MLWQEHISPLVALELDRGDGTEERDNTPLAVANGTEGSRPGKFWVYEQVMRIPYYGIFVVSTGTLEVYHWRDGSYQAMAPNDRGHYTIAPLEVELGLWQGRYQNQDQLWLRWWDSKGNLLLTGTERAAVAEQERDRAVEQMEKVERSQREAASQLAQMGLSPAQIAEALGLSLAEVEGII